MMLSDLCHVHRA